MKFWQVLLQKYYIFNILKTKRLSWIRIKTNSVNFHKVWTLNFLNFRQLGIKISYRNAQIFAYAQIVFMLSMFMIMVTVQPFSGSLAYFVIYSIFNVVDVINTTMLFQYINVLLLVRQRFIWVNRKIREMSHFSKTIITESNQNQVAPMFIESQEKRLDPQNLIINLGKIHSKLFAICKITNR